MLRLISKKFRFERVRKEKEAPSEGIHRTQGDNGEIPTSLLLSEQLRAQLTTKEMSGNTSVPRTPVCVVTPGCLLSQQSVTDRKLHLTLRGLLGCMKTALRHRPASARPSARGLVSGGCNHYSFMFLTVKSSIRGDI